MDRKGILIVVSGFAGTGKGTLMRELLRRFADNYALSVSMTTRQPRPGEREGVEYFFTDRVAFEKKIADDGLIEYASYCGNYYGTPREYVNRQLEEGKDVILEIEVQGALQVKEKFPGAVLMFVVPPSARVLIERIRGRGTETDEVIGERMRRAVEECEFIPRYDYILVNDDLETCVLQMHQIIQSEKLSAVRNTAFIEEITRELREIES